MIGLISANENPEVHRREGLELSTEGFSNLAQREGRTVAKPDESKRSKLQNHFSRVSSSAELGNGQYFVTRLSINNSAGTTLVCRVCYLAVVHIHCWYAFSKLTCASVQSRIQRERVGQEKIVFAVFKPIESEPPQ